jgi:hypothetical protein
MSRTPDEFRARVAWLSSLEDGWLDGGGIAPPERGLLGFAWFALIANDVDGMPLPYLYPTEDGNLEAEWDDPEASVEVDLRTFDMQWDGETDNYREAIDAAAMCVGDMV